MDEASAKSWWQITPKYARSRACFLIALLTLFQVGGFLGAESVWVLEMPIHFQAQWLMLGLLALAALSYACLRERRFGWLDRMLLVAGLGLVSYSALTVTGQTPALRALAPSTPQGERIGRLRILSANLYSPNQNHQAILDLIAVGDFDVIFLMELNTPWRESLTPLTNRYPHQMTNPDDRGNFGIGFWSRIPCESCEMDKFGFRDVHAVLRLPQEVRVRFIGLHPMPPISQHRWEERNRVFAEVTRLLQAEPTLPVIVAGDMNASRYAPSFQRWCRESGLRDAGHHVMGRSWPTGTLQTVLATRIDHILVDDSWRVDSFRIGPDIGSDHYPLMAEVSLIAGGSR